MSESPAQRMQLKSKLPHVGATIPLTRDKDVFTVMGPPFGGAQPRA